MWLHLTPEVMTIRSIDAMSLAKVYAVLYGILGLIMALPMGCFSLLMPPTGEPGLDWIRGFGFLVVVIYPIFAVIVGFVGGLLTAFIYNLVSGWVGGVQIEVDMDNPSTAFV